MKTIFYLLLALILNTSLSAQYFDQKSPEGKNFFIGLGLGDAQLNMQTGSSTYGRSTNIPRLIFDAGVAFPQVLMHQFSVTARFTYQDLYLKNSGNQGYNDRLTFADFQLKPMVHFGKNVIKLNAGISARFPFYSEFQVKSLNSNNELTWYSLGKTIQPKPFIIVPEFGMSFLISDVHVTLGFSVITADYLDSTARTGAYRVQDTEYYTIEFVAYIPLRL